MLIFAFHNIPMTPIDMIILYLPIKNKYMYSAVEEE